MPRADVIFIRGVMGRSGTNYLRDLLVLHPECEGSRPPIWEDFLSAEAAVLQRYVQGTSRWWNAKWNVDVPAAQRDLLACMGDGLQQFLRGDATATKVVAKTPVPAGLEEHLALFPDAPILLLVRDGRSAVESMTRSFRSDSPTWDFEQAIRRWVTGALSILDFAERNAELQGKQFLIVRYEDLLDDLPSNLTRIFSTVGLTPDALPMEAARELPVRGSSSYGTEGGEPQWKTTVAPDETFQPSQRWQGWTPEQHERFNWLAGKPMRALGYELADEDSRLGRAGLVARDAVWNTYAAYQRTRRRLWGRPFDH